jgi:flagellar assembly protein FliH
LTLADDVIDEPEAHTPELTLEAEGGGSQADGSYQSITDERIEEGSDDIKADEPEK